MYYFTKIMEVISLLHTWNWKGEAWPVLPIILNFLTKIFCYLYPF